jgi:hypothetical protein
MSIVTEFFFYLKLSSFQFSATNGVELSAIRLTKIKFVGTLFIFTKSLQSFQENIKNENGRKKELELWLSGI